MKGRSFCVSGLFGSGHAGLRNERRGTPLHWWLGFAESTAGGNYASGHALPLLIAVPKFAATVWPISASDPRVPKLTGVKRFP